MRPGASSLLILAVALATAVSAGAQVRIDVERPSASVDPGSNAALFVRVSNPAGGDLAEPSLHFRFPADVAAIAVDPWYSWTCVTAPGRVDCSGGLPAPASTQYKITFAVPPGHPGGLVPVDIAFQWEAGSASTTVALPVSRRFTVDSTADQGSGSLRDVIERVNAQCDGTFTCKVGFAFPSAAAVPRIEPVTPLPALVVTNVLIGPEDVAATAVVELSGKRVSRGSGLTLRGPLGYTTAAAVHGMIISGFPENGIAVDDSGVAARYEIVGNVIRGNGLRGIAVDAPTSGVYASRNVIGENGRSGVYVRSASLVVLDANYIGLAPDGAVIPNGASGVYFGVATQRANVTGGFIAFNREFGVAIDRGARNIVVLGANIAENAGCNLDWELDCAPSGGPEPPVIFDAVYDPADGKTEVTGELRGTAGEFGNYFSVVVYADNVVTRLGSTAMVNLSGSSGLVKQFGPPGPFAVPFTIALPGDYRGLYLSAQTVVQEWLDFGVSSTSELSRAALAH